MCNNDTSMSTSTSVHKPVKSERAWPDQNTHKHTTQGLDYDKYTGIPRPQKTRRGRHTHNNGIKNGDVGIEINIATGRPLSAEM